MPSQPALTSSRLLRALAAVPLPPDADTARIARLIEAVDLLPGETLLHVGAGLGYATAVMAEMVGSKGRIIAAEINPPLREQAKANLAAWPQVEVVGDALAVELPALDLVFASCGVGFVPPHWTGALKEGGRMLLPLTGSDDGGYGFLFTQTEIAEWLAVRVLAPQQVGPCQGARQPEHLSALDAALANRGLAELRWLRTDPHDADPSCWLHGEGWCISKGDPR
jgi:protein-L-isoaspartate(D-aspartate) O-methyltransferase